MPREKRDILRITEQVDKELGLDLILDYFLDDGKTYLPDKELNIINDFAAKEVDKYNYASKGGKEQYKNDINELLQDAVTDAYKHILNANTVNLSEDNIKQLYFDALDYYASNTKPDYYFFDLGYVYEIIIACEEKLHPDKCKNLDNTWEKYENSLIVGKKQDDQFEICPFLKERRPATGSNTPNSSYNTSYPATLVGSGKIDIEEEDYEDREFEY